VLSCSYIDHHNAKYLTRETDDFYKNKNDGKNRKVEEKHFHQAVNRMWMHLSTHAA